jgi:hypothetical protein
MVSNNHIKLNVFVLCIIISFFVADICTGQDSKLEVRQQGALQSIELSDVGQYSHFSANANYLVWFNYSNRKVGIYSFTDNATKKIQLRQGRGPNEYSQFSAMAIKDNDDIFILDQTNRKYIKIDPKSGSKTDIAISASSKLQTPFRIGAVNNALIVVDAFNTETFFYVLEHMDKGEYPIHMKEEVTLPDRPDPARREGDMSFIGDRMIFATYFYPRLYISDLDNNKLVKMTTFAKANVEQPRPQTDDQGVTIRSAPTEVSLLTHDVAGIPGVPNHVLLLSEGKDIETEKQFSMSKLYEYDLQSEEFVQDHALKVKAEALVRQGQNLYVYSKEYKKVYRYRMSR